MEQFFIALHSWLSDRDQKDDYCLHEEW